MFNDFIVIMNLFATGTGFFGISPSSDQLIVVNLAAILISTSFNSPQKLIKWGGLVVAVVTTTCVLWCSH